MSCNLRPNLSFTVLRLPILVIAATNRVDILDPALLRSGRLDRKIEFPKPDMEARARIMQIHARKMNVDENVNFDELSRCTEDFNGAQCKAVCVEAGMIALRHEVRNIKNQKFFFGSKVFKFYYKTLFITFTRRDATQMHHEDFMEAILEVQAKKKVDLQYYA